MESTLHVVPVIHSLMLRCDDVEDTADDDSPDDDDYSDELCDDRAPIC